MKNLLIYSVLILLISCKDSTKKDIHKEQQNLDSELYNEILNYQKKVKIPKISNKEISPGVKSIETALIYIYEAKFYIENKDTLVSFTLNSNGINYFYSREIPISEKIYGIYNDDSLKPTYIVDPQKIGIKYVKKYLHQKDSIEKYIQKVDFINDAMYDVYVYKVKGKKLVFDKILMDNQR